MKNTLNRKRLAAGLVVVAALAVSCHVSKDVAAPEMGLPTVYRDGTANADTTSTANIPWQSFFSDDDLKVLIADALAQNNDLQVAVKNIAAAELLFRQSKLGNVPTLDVQATASSIRPSDNSLNGLTLNESLQTKHIEDYTIAASLSWEADVWGKIRSQKAAALAEFLRTGEARKAVQTQLVSDVSKGYYNLLMLDAQMRIALQNVRLNDSTLAIISLQFQAGQVTSLAIQQATAQKLTAEGLVPQFEQQIAVQENALSVLCGRLPAPVKHDAALSSVTINEEFATGLPLALLANRPDVRQAELALTKANANVGYAKANMYPSLTITAQGGLDAFKASNWFNIPASLFGAVAGSLTQPLFQQKKLSTLYRVSLVNRDQTVIQFRQSVLVAVSEVSDALVSIAKLKRQESLASDRTATLQVATHNSQLLFKNGMATYLEVITAQGNVLESELELAAIRKSRLEASVELYRSLGGGGN